MTRKSPSEKKLDDVLAAAEASNDGEEDIRSETADELARAKERAEQNKRARESRREFFANFNALFAEQLTPELLKRFRALPPGDTDQTWLICQAAYVRALDQSAFVRIKDKAMVGDEFFNELYAPLVRRLDIKGKLRGAPPTKLAVSGDWLKKASAAVFEPGQADWPTPTTFNIWSPSDITPLAPTYDELGESNDIILEHIRYLIPNKRERRLLCDFLKWAIQHPEHKMKFALVIVGDKGTGKSWFAKLLVALMGKRNVLVFSKADNAAKTFNAEQKNRQAIFVDEIMPGGKGDLVAAIEPLIIGTEIRIEPKGVDAFYISNRTNIMGVTNYANALKLDRKARKWAIVQSTQDEYGSDTDGTPTAASTAYYNRLHATTPDDGAGPVTDDVRRFLWYLQHDPVSADFDPDHAPETDAKNEVAEATETTTESLVHGMVASPADTVMQFELVTVADVLDELGISPQHPDIAKIRGQVTTAMAAAGCRRLEVGQVYFGRNPRRLWVTRKKLLPKFEHMTHEQLRDFYQEEREAEGTKDFGADFEPEPATDPAGEAAAMRSARRPSGSVH